MATKKPKTNVNDYKDRMTSPFGIKLTGKKKAKKAKKEK